MVEGLGGPGKWRESVCVNDKRGAGEMRVEFGSRAMAGWRKGKMW